ncbi:MAG: efflux RND transporter periplasmic adaptor subunit [Pirellulales bacterium]
MDHSANGQSGAGGGTSAGHWWGRVVRVLVPLSILGIGGGAYGILSQEPDEAKLPPAVEQPIRTRVVEIDVCDYPVKVSSNGIVQAHQTIMLSAEVAGRVVRLSPSFEVGSYVAEGEDLVELDASDFESNVGVAEARCRVAQASLQLAGQRHDRVVRLHERSGASEAELESSRAIQEQAAAEADSAKAQLALARRQLEQTRIRAPFAGRVRSRAVGLGALVGPGTPLGEIFAVDYAEVRLPISGRELSFVDLPEKAGDRPVDVELRDAVDGAHGTVWSAQIVRTEGALDANSLELFAIARIDDPYGLNSPHRPLRVGQPVVAAISGRVLPSVVALPRGAVRQLDQVILVDQQRRQLSTQKVQPIWSDERCVVVEHTGQFDGVWLSTTQLPYAPEGAKVEILNDADVVTTSTSGPDAADPGAASHGGR